MKTISTDVLMRVINICVSFICVVTIAVFLIAPMPDGRMTFVNPAAGQDGYWELTPQLGQSLYFQEKSLRYQGAVTATAAAFSAPAPQSINCNDGNYFIGLPLPDSSTSYSDGSVALDVTSAGDGCPKIIGFAADGWDTGWPSATAVKWSVSSTGATAVKLLSDRNTVPSDSLIPYDISPLGDVIVGKLNGFNSQIMPEQWGFVWRNGTVTRQASSDAIETASDACRDPAVYFASVPNGTVRDAIGFFAHDFDIPTSDPNFDWGTLQCAGIPLSRSAVPGVTAGAGISSSTHAVSVGFQENKRRILVNAGNPSGGHRQATFEEKVGTNPAAVLQELADNFHETYGEAISEDGKFAAGYGISSGEYKGIIWNIESRSYEVPTSLTNLDMTTAAVTDSWFRDVSDNGVLAVGSVKTNDSTRCTGKNLGIAESNTDANAAIKAVIWVGDANGWETVSPRGTLLRLEDLPILSPGGALHDAIAGWDLCEATSISRYGDTIAGVGINPQNARQAFVVHFTSPLPYITKDTISVPGSGREVAIGDFNGDQIQDIATLHYIPKKLSIAYGKVGGGYDSYTISLSFFPSTLAAGDFNRDGRDDLAVMTDGKLHIFDGTVTRGALTPRFVSQYGGEIRHRYVIAADINRDQKLDLAIITNSSPSMGQVSALYVVFGNGDGTFAPEKFVNLGWSAGEPNGIVALDFDNDGDLDLATVNRVGFTVSIVRTDIVPATNAASFSVTTVQKQTLPGGGSDFNYPYSIAAGDFDADGYGDLVVANQMSGPVTILYGGGNGVFGARREYGPTTDIARLLATDFNADGATDLLIAGYSAAKVQVYQRGVGTWSKRQEFSLPAGAMSIKEADINGDGKKDFAVSTTGTSTQTFLRN